MNTPENQSAARPTFTLGVTGNMDLDFSEPGSRDALVRRLRLLLLFIRFGYEAEDPCEGGFLCSAPKSGNSESKSETLGEKIAALLPKTEPPDDLSDRTRRLTEEDAKRSVWLAGFEEWEGLGEKTEMVLLSSLAPGADSLVVRVFRALCSRVEGFNGRVRAPLPFPEELYEKATTFNGPDAPEEENAGRRREFKKLAGRLRDEDRFPVYLNKDVGEHDALEDEEAFSKILERDLNDPVGRNRRYQAAGEYVATFSDLLIAVYDDRIPSESQVGSEATVESKRRGTTFQLLPFTDAYSWADNGPVFHLYHPRLKTQAKAKEMKVPVPDDGSRTQHPFRILHPYDLGPDDSETRDALDDFWEIDSVFKEASGTEQRERLWRQFIKWQKTGNLLIMRIAGNLREFNDSKIVNRGAEDSALLKLCGLKEGDSLERAYGKETSAFVEDLDSIARVQTRSSENATPLQRETDKTLWRLFLLSFSAAFCLHVFAHWHPFGHSDCYRHHQEDLHGAHEPGEAEHGRGVEKTIRTAFGIGAVLLAVAGLVLFSLQVNSQREERQNDTRSFSEALRVQFYWALSGLRRSVAGNYMQRTRSEMDWIRNAVSSMVFPLERFQSRFLNLKRKNQFKLLKTAVHRWVGPPIATLKERKGARKNKQGQENYFFNARKKRADKRHCFHTAGSLIALAGLWHIPFLLSFYLSCEWMLWARDGWSMPVSMIIVGFALIYSAAAWRRALHEGFRGREICRNLPRIWPLKDFVRDSLHHHESSRHILKEEKRRHIAWRNFRLLALPGLGLALISISMCLLVSRCSAGFWPGPLDLGIVAAGICLLGGALLVAYVEKELLAELSQQYQAAGKLFFSARIRLEEYLEKAKEALDRGDDDRFDDCRLKIQALLFAVGREALDENSEWLILHRARPMEPVMAG